MNPIERTNLLFRKDPNFEADAEEGQEILKELYEVRQLVLSKLTRIDFYEREKLNDWIYYFTNRLREQGVDPSVDSICAVSMDEVMERR